MAPKAKAAAKSPGKAPKKAVEKKEKKEKKEKGERGGGGVGGRPFEVEPTGGRDRGSAGRPGTLARPGSAWRGHGMRQLPARALISCSSGRHGAAEALRQPARRLESLQDTAQWCLGVPQLLGQAADACLAARGLRPAARARRGCLPALLAAAAV